MKYLLCTILLAVAIGVAGPPLYFAPHVLPLSSTIYSGLALGFACYLFDPTRFLEYAAEARKNLKAVFMKGGDA